MSLDHLRSFLEVYRCRTISGAARNLNLTQPAVSQHVASLEQQVGKKLFERHVRGVEPTSFANDLASQIGNGIDRIEMAMSTAKARSSSISGTVHIAGPAELVAEMVAPQLGSLQNSGLELRIHLGGKSDLYELLLKGQVDIALTASLPRNQRLDSIKIGTETLLAVATPVMADQISRGASLEDYPLVAYDVEKPLIRDWCLHNQVSIDHINPSFTAPDLRVLRALVETGIGWSVIPDYLCKDAVKHGRLGEIKAPMANPENNFYLVWNKSSLRHPRIAFAQQALLKSIKITS